jgi:thioester reductase-like protein
MKSDIVIFLTGATGLLGGEILKSVLVSEPHARVIVLVRGDPARYTNLIDDTLRAEFAGRIEPVWGDLEKPGLGLDSRARAEITERITHVIHSAASIDFAMPYAAAHAVNYDGTARVHDLAREARHLQAFAHISTAYVAGRRTGVITEDELEHDAGFVNAYEHSKYESEQFLRARMGELPIAVYRPVTMIGNSRDGVVRQFNYIHHSLRFLYHGLVPVIPAAPNMVVDVIPADWAADVVCFLTLHSFRQGATYHICSDPQNSFSIQEFIDVTCRTLGMSPYSKRRHVPAPPILTPAEFKMMMEQARQAGRAERLLQLLRPFSYFIEHLSLPKVFEATNQRRDLGARQLVVPPIISYYAKVIDYCLKTDWGRLADSSRRVHEPVAGNNSTARIE